MKSIKYGLERGDKKVQFEHLLIRMKRRQSCQHPVNKL